MREIKFRAWLSARSKDPSEGIMYSPEEVYFVAHGEANCDGDVMSFEDGLTIEQYTGLHDKNGKEIYEGDIILHEKRNRPHSENTKTCKVRSIVEWYSGVMSKDGFIAGEPCFRGREIYNEKGYSCYFWTVFSFCEVIGNIHENPELLAQS
jgi:uncharacterized phage protein (TIGR01671 family)